MSAESTWVRVNRATPCPICERFDWCSTSRDGAVAICMRVGSSKPTKNGGFLHRLMDVTTPRPPRPVFLSIKSTPPDLSLLVMSLRQAATVEQLAALAARLGVSGASLTAFQVGWSHNDDAYSFPMFDPRTGPACGIRLRGLNGSKWATRGSNEGLFMPRDLDASNDTLLVVEGASDAIAAYDIGFPNAVGRPSCTGGVPHVVALVRAQRPATVVIVRDNDEPGVRGAETLASTLTLHCRDVRVIAPPAPAKDMRDWVAAGATRADLEQRIQAAYVRRLNMHSTPKGIA